MDINNEKTWLAHLDKKYLSCEEDSVEHDIALIMKDMLLSNDRENASLTAAHQINTYYWDRNLDSGPLFRFQNEEERVSDFLTFIYDIIISGIAPFVPYYDSRHDTLVKLVIELYRLPPRTVKAWNGDRLVPLGEDMFPSMLDEAWSGTYASDSREKTASPSEWKQECSEWLNLSSFIARCTGSRVDDHLPDITKYTSIDIREGLEKEIPPGLTKDTRVMVAAQHILLAGHVIDEQLIQKSKGSWGLEKWQVWAKRLKELIEREDLAPEVKIAAVEARKKLVELHPELFPTSEGGNKPDL